MWENGCISNWFVFFLLRGRFWWRQRPRFRFGEGELLVLGGFNFCFFGLTPLRHFGIKLIHENIDLRTPSKGHRHKLLFFDFEITVKSFPGFFSSSFKCIYFITRVAEQSIASLQNQHHRSCSTPLVSMRWGLRRKNSRTDQIKHIVTQSKKGRSLFLFTEVFRNSRSAFF